MLVRLNPYLDLPQFLLWQFSLAEIAVRQGDDRLLPLICCVKMRCTILITVQVQNDILTGFHEKHICFQDVLVLNEKP